MANTFTTNYTLVRSEIGANNDNWGSDLNSGLTTIDSQIVRKMDKADLVDQTSQNISFTTSNEILSSVANVFQNYRAGDQIRISGASSGANNGLHLITSKTNPQTLVVSTTLTQEAAAATITYRLVPKFDEVDIDGGTVNGATIAESDITVGTGKTLDVSAGTLTLAAGQIATAAIADDAITAAKIDDGAVGTAAVANDAVTYAKIQDTTTNNRVLGAATAGEVGEVQIATAMIEDDAVTYAKIQDTTVNNRVLGAATAGAVSEVQVATDMIADDAVTYAKMQDTSAAKVILGSDDANAAPVEELSKSDVLTMLNVEDGANNYSLPTADANTLGGIKVGDRLTIDNNDVLSADIPAVATTSANGLMSSGDKTKLDGIATGAEVNVQSDWNATSGAAVILNQPNVQYTSAIPDATASQTGLATATQITKLDGIPASGIVTSSNIASNIPGTYARIIQKHRFDVPQTTLYGQSQNECLHTAIGLNFVSGNTYIVQYFFSYEVVIPTTPQQGHSALPTSGYKMTARFEVHTPSTQFSRGNTYNQSNTPLAFHPLYHASDTTLGTWFQEVTLTGFHYAFHTGAGTKYPVLVMKTDTTGGSVDTWSAIKCPPYVPNTSGNLQTEIRLIVWEIDGQWTSSTT